jgi:hypothetical protein
MTYSGATSFNNPSGRYGRAATTTYSARNTTYTRAGVIPINTVLATYDCNNFRSASVQCTSMGTTGVVTPEWSNDNTTWVAATSNTPPGATATTISSAGLFIIPVVARYLRLRLSTATTAGTTTFATSLFNDDHQIWLATQPISGSVTVSGTVTSNIGTGSLAAGTAAIGDVGVQYRAGNTGAASVVSVISPVTPASTTIKSSAGRLIGYQLQNSAASLRSVKVFNATAPTLGTTAAVFEIDIPANDTVMLQFTGGLSFATAITYSVTATKGLTDNTSTGLALADVSGYFAFA